MSTAAGGQTNASQAKSGPASAFEAFLRRRTNSVAGQDAGKTGSGSPGASLRKAEEDVAGIDGGGQRESTTKRGAAAPQGTSTPAAGTAGAVGGKGLVVGNYSAQTAIDGDVNEPHLPVADGGESDDSEIELTSSAGSPSPRLPPAAAEAGTVIPTGGRGMNGNSGDTIAADGDVWHGARQQIRGGNGVGDSGAQRGGAARVSVNGRVVSPGIVKSALSVSGAVGRDQASAATSVIIDLPALSSEAAQNEHVAQLLDVIGNLRSRLEHANGEILVRQQMSVKLANRVVADKKRYDELETVVSQLKDEISVLQGAKSSDAQLAEKLKVAEDEAIVLREEKEDITKQMEQWKANLKDFVKEKQKQESESTKDFLESRTKLETKDKEINELCFEIAVLKKDKEERERERRAAGPRVDGGTQTDFQMFADSLNAVRRLSMLPPAGMPDMTTSDPTPRDTSSPLPEADATANRRGSTSMRKLDLKKLAPPALNTTTLTPTETRRAPTPRRNTPRMSSTTPTAASLRGRRDSAVESPLARSRGRDGSMPPATVMQSRSPTVGRGNSESVNASAVLSNRGARKPSLVPSPRPTHGFLSPPDAIREVSNTRSSLPPCGSPVQQIIVAVRYHHRGKDAALVPGWFPFQASTSSVQAAATGSASQNTVASPRRPSTVGKLPVSANTVSNASTSPKGVATTAELLRQQPINAPADGWEVTTKLRIPVTIAINELIGRICDTLLTKYSVNLHNDEVWLKLNVPRHARLHTMDTSYSSPLPTGSSVLSPTDLPSTGSSSGRTTRDVVLCEGRELNSFGYVAKLIKEGKPLTVVLEKRPVRIRHVKADNVLLPLSPPGGLQPRDSGDY